MQLELQNQYEKIKVQIQAEFDLKKKGIWLSLSNVIASCNSSRSCEQLGK